MLRCNKWQECPGTETGCKHSEPHEENDECQEDCFSSLAGRAECIEIDDE
jgi:hypothetical protein